MAERTTHRGLVVTWMCLIGLALAASAAMAYDGQGFLYGKITTDSGKEYTGFLRWSDEEACWNDLFHSLKEDLPYREEADWADESWRDRDRPRESRIRIFGKDIVILSDNDDYSEASRVFICRFGDIEKIRVTGSDDAEIYLKSGSHLEVSGYSNDVGTTVRVQDEAFGDIDIRWNRIETIEFMPVPRGRESDVFRLHGKVETAVGELEGFIQWDKEECLSSDELDGDTIDGDVSIPFGNIRSIEREGRHSSTVELKDGRSMRLRDSNDVNSENRGIMVEDPRYGRLTVPWSEFDRILFSDAGSSGRGYEDFPPAQALQGSVRDIGGKQYRGRIVIDLDEAEGWEMLNGSWEDVECDIPLAMVEKIVPRSRHGSMVTLTTGETLRLEDGQDVSDRNDGVLVFEDGEDPVYIAWDEVEEISFR